MKPFWLALSFLTTLPARQVPYTPGGLGQAGLLFPLIGLILGGILSGAGYLLTGRLPDLIAAILLVALWALLTGGLHLDGFADCCDGLLVPADREKRLRIMRDSRIGAFAVIGLILLLTLKIAAVEALVGNGNWLAGLLLAPVIGRWLLLPLARQPTAQPDGLGAGFQSGLEGWRIGVALILPLILLVWQGTAGFLAFALAVTAAAGWAVLARRRIGGISGDILGAVVESSETLTLIAFTLL